MDRLISGVELAAAQEASTELRACVADMHTQLVAEQRRRRELEKKVDELLERRRTQQVREDLDWRETVNAATAWLQQAASKQQQHPEQGGRGGGSGDPASKPPSQQPKVRVRADIFEE